MLLSSIADGLKAGFETYQKESKISAAAAAEVISTISGGDFDFTDFECRTESDPLDWDRFESSGRKLICERGAFDQTLKAMFDTVANEVNAQYVTKLQVINLLTKAGIAPTDSRLNKLGSWLRGQDEDATVRISPREFVELCSDNISFLKRLILSDVAIPEFTDFSNDLNTLYEIVSANRSGSNADYIPILKNANPERWGVSFCSVDGQRYNKGDVHDFFSIQSMSKPITYGVALSELGSEITHSWVGMEPSGKPFNAPDLLPDCRPYNPMVNAGAIMTCSVVTSAFNEKTSEEVIEKLRSIWESLTGRGVVRLSEETMISERSTADNNFALAYLMRSKKGLPAPLEKTLDAYFGVCALELTCEDLSVAAATLANGGLCPTTGEKVFSSETVKSILSLMSSSGMYDFSGEFLYKIGIPAKSGVGGGIFVVIPNLGGFATFSPRLDRYGNSVRGGEFFSRLIQNFAFHSFDNVSGGFNGFKKAPGNTRANNIQTGSSLLWASRLGDTRALKIVDGFNKVIFSIGQKVKGNNSVQYIQEFYARSMHGYVSKLEIEEVLDELGVGLFEEALNQIRSGKSEWESKDQQFLIDAFVIFLDELSTSMDIKQKSMRELLRAFEVKEDLIDFITKRIDGVKLEDLIELHGFKTKRPTQADLSKQAPSLPPPLELTFDQKVATVLGAWDIASRKKHEFGKMFYSRLLWTDPDAAVLFRKTAMAEQVEKLTHTLDVAISKISRLQELESSLIVLGNKHVTYGVKEHHYSSVRDSLIWALANTLGAERWTKEIEISVGWVIDEVASVMLQKS